jgi:hypothetical protein
MDTWIHEVCAHIFIQFATHLSRRVIRLTSPLRILAILDGPKLWRVTLAYPIATLGRIKSRCGITLPTLFNDSGFSTVD